MNASESCHTSNECSETVNRSNYVFISMNGRPTDPPYVYNACPTRTGLDNRLDRFDGSDENYLIGYYATYQRAFTSSSVVWRGIANGIVDPLAHRNYFYDPSKRSLRLQASGGVRLPFAYRAHRFSATWVGGGRPANLICFAKLNCLLRISCPCFLIDARFVSFEVCFSCIFSSKRFYQQSR